MNLKSLSFFTAVDNSEEHQDFAVPFIASALITHPYAYCEVLVPDVGRFYGKYGREMLSLHDTFPNDRFTVVPWRHELLEDGFRKQPCAGAFVRFLSQPSVYEDWTYISDVDMLFVSDILQENIDIMKKTGLPYASIVRPGSKRVAGTFMVDSHEYYRRMDRAIADYLSCPGAYYYPILNDEELLYVLVNESGIGFLPDEPEYKTGEYRPISAIHTSIHRSIMGKVGDGGKPLELSWGVTDKKMEGVTRLFASDDWKRIVLPDRYRERVVVALKRRSVIKTTEKLL